MNFRFNQIPNSAKVNITLNSIIANPLTAVSGNTILDYTRVTAATPIKVWYNMTGLKPTYVYRYVVDPPGADNYILSNASGGLHINSTLTGTHQYIVYDYGIVTDITPPTITINFAGNHSDKGGPYYLPPGETTALSGTNLNGYYTNSSYQSESWVYINLTVTDASTITSVVLHWRNVSTNKYLNTSGFIKKNTDYYEINTSVNITNITAGHKYSFDVYATDSSGNVKKVFWNKTDIGGDITRRYVYLKNTPASITYIPLYFHNSTIWAITDQHKYDRLEKDQGLNSGQNDVGYLTITAPTATKEYRYCGTFVGSWFNNNSCIVPFSLTNIYFHVWYSIRSIVTHVDIGWYKSRQDSVQTTTNKYTFYNTESVSQLYIPHYTSDPTYYTNNFNLSAKLLSTTSTSMTDNDIYQVTAKMVGEGATIIDNRSFTSFILLNVPSNATLNISYVDTDSDGLTDWYELYRSYTNPFLADTDNDGQVDSYEAFYGSDPNNYSSMYSALNPIVTTNASTGVEETTATLNGYLINSSIHDPYTWNLIAGNNYITFLPEHITAAGTDKPEGMVHNHSTPANCITWVWQIQGGGWKSWYRDRDPGFNTLIHILPNVQCMVTSELICVLQINGSYLCNVSFQYGLTTSYGTNTVNQTKTSHQTFQQAITALTQGKLYHFRAHANNCGRTGNGIDWTFLTKPEQPTAFTITNTGTDNNQLFNWVHGTGYNQTVIRGKIGGYPATPQSDTSIYNASGASTTINNTIVTPGKPYYYRAWEYTPWGLLHQFSDAYAQTTKLSKPYAPTHAYGTRTAYNLATLNWTKGTGANRTIVRYKETGFPTSWSDGTLIYNGTGIATTTALVNGTVYYFTAFSYTSWGGFTSVYSDNGTDFMNITSLGGFIINCYDEVNNSNLTFNVLITNQTGTQTYQRNGCVNPQIINASLCPHGTNINVIVSAADHQTRVYTMNLYSGVFYTLDTYLPPTLTPPATNDSYLYYLRVMETVSYPQNFAPVEGVKLYIKAYLNGSFVIISSFYTDANGYVNCYLIPNKLYLIQLNKTGYVEGYSNYIPDPPNSWGQTTEKVFMVVRNYNASTNGSTEPKTFWGYCTLEGTLYGNNTIHVSYVDLLCHTSNALFTVWDEYNGTLTLIGSSGTINCVYGFWMNITNSSHTHKVSLSLNHTDFGYQLIWITVNPYSNVSSNTTRWIEDTSTSVFGSFPPGIVNFFCIWIPCIFFLLIPGNKHIEIGIVMAGFVLGILSIKLTLPVPLLALIPVIILIGILYYAVKHGKAKI
jgi:hypothetical protein